jgi:hypothetical protein
MKKNHTGRTPFKINERKINTYIAKLVERTPFNTTFKRKLQIGTLLKRK